MKDTTVRVQYGGQMNYVSGEKILWMIHRKGLTEAGFRAKSGISKQNFYRIIGAGSFGCRVNSETLGKLLRTLECSPSEIAPDTVELAKILNGNWAVDGTVSLLQSLIISFAGDQLKLKSECFDAFVKLHAATSQYLSGQVKKLNICSHQANSGYVVFQVDPSTRVLSGQILFCPIINQENFVSFTARKTKDQTPR